MPFFLSLSPPCFSFSTFIFLLFCSPSPLLLHRLLHSLHPYSAQVDRCLAGWPVIITVVLGVSGGWRWLFFEYFTARTGQDRTFPGAMGGGRRNEDTSREDSRNEERKKKSFNVCRFYNAFYNISIQTVVTSQ